MGGSYDLRLRQSSLSQLFQALGKTCPHVPGSGPGKCTLGIPSGKLTVKSVCELENHHL